MRYAFVFLLGVFCLAAGGAEAARPPILSVTPGSLSFSAPEGGPNSGPQTLTIMNSGNGSMDWTATVTSAWLSVVPSSGRLATGKSIDVSVLVDVVGPGLTAGSYADTITIDAMGVTGSPQLVPVDLTVSSAPVLDATPTALTFNAGMGGPNPPTQTVTVSNVGGGTLNWTAVTVGGAAWLGLSPASGSLTAGASTDITVTVDVVGPGLAAGSYPETITIDAGAVAGSPQSVTVDLTVSSTPVLDVTPPTLSFTAPVGGPNPASQTVTVTNAGGGTLNWTATTVGGAAWLGLSLTAGSLSAGASDTITVSIDVITTALADGIYMETITVDGGGASGSPATVDVRLDVSSLAVISLNPTSLTFNAPVGGGNPATQAVSITNSGSATLNWTATDSATWLNQNPASGMLPDMNGNQSEPMTVSVSVAGLAPGTHTATIQVADAGATNSPQIIFVTLNVPPPVPRNTIEAGQCGGTGVEIFLPLLLLSLVRRKRRREGRS